MNKIILNVLILLCVTANLFADIDKSKRNNINAFYEIGFDPIAKTGVEFLDSLFNGRPEKAFSIMKVNADFKLQGHGTAAAIKRMGLDKYRILTYDLKAYKQLSTESGIFFFAANTKTHGPLFIKLGFYFKDDKLYLAYFDVNNNFDKAIKTLDEFDELEYAITSTAD